MKQSGSSWIWKFYLLLYVFFTSAHLLYFFLPESPMRLYYHIAVAFNTYFFGIYFLNLTTVVLNFLSVIPLYFYIYRINILNKNFWCWFFVIRLAFDLTGHNYEMNLLKSVSYDNALISMKSVLNYTLFTFPSYVALYTYAFKNRSSKKTPKP